jgi:hypothetical protein
VEVHDQRKWRGRFRWGPVDPHGRLALRAGDRPVLEPTLLTYATEDQVGDRVVPEGALLALEHLGLRHLGYRPAGKRSEEGTDAPGSEGQRRRGNAVQFT